MQFGTISKDGQAYQVLYWPTDICQDPEKIPAALRASRLDAGVASSELQALQPSQWRELVKSTPKTWMDLEWQLAQLVVQLVLYAHHQEVLQEGDRPGNKTEAHSGAADAEESEDELDADPAAAPLTGRAAKRARQRERRRMGRAAARADKAAGKEPQVVTPLPQVRSNSSLQGLAGQPSVADLLEEVAVPQQGTYPLLGSPSTVPVAFPPELPTDAAILDADGAGPIRPPGLEEGQETIASLTNLWEPEEDFDGNSSGRGMGRGKPLKEGKDAAGHPGGIPFPAMGRGRPLKSSAPVRPGSARQHPMPGGLSQLWMPPPIPEEEVGVEAGEQDQTQLDILISSLALGNRPYGLSDHDIDIHTPSYWSGGSYAPTPVNAWPETPSPSSNVSPAIRPGSTAAAALALAGVAAEFPPFLQLSPPPHHVGPGYQGHVDGGTHPIDTDVDATAAVHPPLTGAPIPTYVTVPLAMANSCPHCGKSFAVPPSSKPYSHAIGVT